MPVEERRVIEYALQICSALGAAHKEGIIHRDIKPHNILIDKQDNLKVTDFGIAKSVTSKIIKSGQVIGSVYYVSPEQAKGEEIDIRSDIYSFGIVMYEMLTGQLPYTGEKSVAVALKHINEQIKPPKQLNADISESINRIILKATSKDKNDRYESIEELKKDLTLSLVDKSGNFVNIKETKSSSFLPINLRKSKIWKTAVIAVMLVLLTLAGVFGGNALFSNTQIQPVQTAFYKLPSLIGMSFDEAKNVLEGMGYTVTALYINSDKAAEGTVMEQSPEAGSGMQAQDTILLTVSAGPEVVYMPNLVGLTETEAIKVIEDMGLKLAEKNYDIDNTVLAGTVISQVPIAESDILPDTEVNIVISSLPEKETGIVPQVVDTTLEQAAENLSEAGFLNIYVYMDDSDKEPGVVISQSPEQGLPSQFDVDIDLKISRFTDEQFIGLLNEEIKITEMGSKVKIVYEDTAGNINVNYVSREMLADPGDLLLSMEMSARTGGTKKIKVYVNKILSYEYSIYFFERNVSDAG